MTGKIPTNQKEESKMEKEFEAIQKFRAHLADRVKANKTLWETWGAKMAKEPTEAQRETYEAHGTMCAFEAMLEAFDRMVGVKS